MTTTRITPLKRPLTRRVGRLVVTIDTDGIRFRGKHKKRWRAVTWSQVASLASSAEPLIAMEEAARGARELERIGAIENGGSDTMRQHRPEAIRGGAGEDREASRAGVGEPGAQDGSRAGGETPAGQ